MSHRFQEKLLATLWPRWSAPTRRAGMVASWLLISSALLPLSTHAQSSATPRKTASKAPVTVNFVNADIEAVSRAMGVIMNRQFIVDPRVKGTITVYSEKPLTPNEAYLNYLVALRGMGAAVVESSGFYKVVPEADAKVLSEQVSVGNNGIKGDRIITQIFRLQYENANNLVPVLRPLISPNNTINVNPGNNSLIITDYADNLNRMAKIITVMDMPNNADMEVVTLKNAVAADILPLLQKIIEPGASGGPAGAPGSANATTTLLADARTNSLLIKAPNNAKLNSIKQIIAKLDVTNASGTAGSNIYVVYLKHAEATKLAQILRAAYITDGNKGGSSLPSPVTPTAANPMSNASGTTPGGQSAQATAPVTPSEGPQTGGFVQADPATNSLVITAPEPMYRQLRAVIEQLDSRRAQVYVEALIVEVNANKAADVGFQWQNIIGQKGDSVVAGLGTNFGSGAGNIVNLSGAAAGGTNGLKSLLTTAGSIGAGFNFGILKKVGELYTVGALAKFLQTNVDGNILSMPTLLTLDNEEAKIVVGQNVPFLTGSYANAGTSGSVNPFQTVERKDVGLTLRIKPQIGENGTVRLTIYQETSSVVDATNNAGLITKKRSIESQVIVDDGAMLAIGGLMEDEYSGTASKVPGLGDVPLLGSLFRSESRSNKKTNLMVFLRPVVVRSAEDANQQTLDRYDVIRASQQNKQPEKRWLMQINEAPIIPPLPPTSGAKAPSVMIEPLNSTAAPAPAVTPQPEVVVPQ